LRLEHGFIGRHLKRPIRLMPATAGAPGGPAPGARPVTGGAVHRTPAIAIVIPRPLVHAMTDGGLTRRAAPSALPRVGVQWGAARRPVVGHEAPAGPSVGMITAPKAMGARLP
jgi:hypothetical protein